MIWGIEGRHAWFPPDGSGVLRKNIARTPNPDVTIGAWSGVGSFFNNAATVTRDTVVTAPLGLPACVKVVTPGLLNVEGCRIILAENVVKGHTYKISAYVRGALGGEQVRMCVGAAATGQAITAADPRSTTFTRIFLTWTATESGTAQLAFTGSGEVKAQTFYVAAANIEDTDTFRPYFPTPADLITKRAAFTGVSYESPATMEAPALTLNLLTDDAGNKLWPRFKVTRVSGLMNLGDAEDKADLPVRRIGELSRLSFRRGKTVTYEGRVEARSLRQLREAEATFREAFADESREGRMDVTPHPLNEDFFGVPAKFYTARALGCDIIDQQGSNSYRRPFVAALRLHDPLYYDVTPESGTITTVKTDLEVEIA